MADEIKRIQTGQQVNNNSGSVNADKNNNSGNDNSMSIFNKLSAPAPTFPPPALPPTTPPTAPPPTAPPAATLWDSDSCFPQPPKGEAQKTFDPESTMPTYPIQEAPVMWDASPEQCESYFKSMEPKMKEDLGLAPDAEWNPADEKWDSYFKSLDDNSIGLYRDSLKWNTEKPADTQKTFDPESTMPVYPSLPDVLMP